MTGTRSLRVAFLGNDAWSVPSLGALAGSRHRVVAVTTAEPKPAGRGNELTPTPVATEAERLGVPLIQTATVKTGENARHIRPTEFRRESRRTGVSPRRAGAAVAIVISLASLSSLERSRASRSRTPP